jgi:hypothetical protein
MHKYRYMKNFITHILEAAVRAKRSAVSTSKRTSKAGAKVKAKVKAKVPTKVPTKTRTKEFADRWSSLISSVSGLAADDRRADIAVMAPWLLTGHVGDNYTSREIERMKERVFGKIGSSEILFYTGEHGIVTFPAKANLTHSDIEGDTSLARGLDQEKVKLLGRSTVWARGRVQHGEVGIISLYPRPEYRQYMAAMIRSLERAYPGYQIHDGRGNLWMEAVAVKKKGKAAGVKSGRKPRELAKIKNFGSKFSNLRKALINRTAARPNFMMGDRTGEVADALENPWTLTGHEGDFTNSEIEAMKRKVFGSGTEHSELFFWVNGTGMVKYSAAAGIDGTSPTHSDYADEVVKRNKASGSGRIILGYGRIEHHNGGRGVISFYTVNRADLAPALRSIRRQYPKYVIHDGRGREYMDESRRRGRVVL